MTIHRRTFLQSIAATVGLGLWPMRGRAIDRRAGDDLAALVRWVEDTPRDRLLTPLVQRIRDGLAADDLLRAVALAAARGVQPVPDVGFKYHANMVLHAVQRAAADLGSEERWLPLIWAADNFKRAQATEQRRSGWTMSAPSPPKADDAARACSRLEQALDQWDREAADRAVVDCARVATPATVFEVLFVHAARDFRAIGHKTVMACNTYRLVPTLGWDRAEPVLRSLVAAIQNHGDGPSPAAAPGRADRPWHHNRRRAESLPAAWRDGAHDASAAQDLLDVFRQGNDLEASDAVHELLKRGLGPGTVWDAIFSAVGELMLRHSGIFSIHANTAANALHQAFAATSDPSNRALILLQAAAFMPRFRELLPRQRALSIDTLEPTAVTSDDPLAEIFTEVSRDRRLATAKVLGYLQADGDPGALVDRARRLIIHKTTNYHDYKFSEAVFENYHHMSPRWRSAYLASGTLYLNGTGDADNQVVAEARHQLQG